MKRRSTMALALTLALLLAACGAPPAPAAETGAAPAQTAATTPEPVSDWQSEGRAYKQSPVNTGADSTFDIFGLGADYYATAMFFGTDGPSEYILLKNGAEIFRVQETMTRILCAYGVTDNNVYVISNGIFATEGEGTEHALSLVRHVPLGGVNLSRIDAVNAISREICDEAEALLIRAETLTPEKPLTHVFACALGAASFCYLFGGSLLDSAAAFPIGLLLQIYLFAAQKRRSGFMPYIWGSGLVTLLSGLLSALFPALSASWVVIGGIVPMVPGVTFTTSIREFFNGDYLSGVIHCISAVLTAVCIALGVCGGAMLLGFMGGIAL